MSKNLHRLNRRVTLGLLFLLVSATVVSQNFRLPPIPRYDSSHIQSYNGATQEKGYFLKKQKVLHIGYNTGSMFYAAFYHAGFSEEDSCYAYFNGSNHDEYDFYYMAKSFIRTERYAENSKIFHHAVFDWKNTPIETGDYYFIKQMYERTITHSPKYKIGKWIKFDSLGKPIETIDYDNSSINNQPLRFTGHMAIIDTLRQLADHRLKETYGTAFFSKYIRFNLDRSGYHTTATPRPEQPDGNSFLKNAHRAIHFVDFSYDIVLGDERFNVIHFRISREGNFLGRTYYPDFVTKYFYLTQGLDTLNNGKLHKNVLNWKKVAKKKGLNVNSRDFNVKFEFSPTSDQYGDLRFILEQVTETHTTKNSFTNKLKQFIINPWTGEIKQSSNEEATESIMIETGVEIDSAE